MESGKQIKTTDYDPEKDEVLKLEALMQPLLLQSMSQTEKDADFGKPEVSVL